MQIISPTHAESGSRAIQRPGPEPAATAGECPQPRMPPFSAQSSSSRYSTPADSELNWSCLSRPREMEKKKSARMEGVRIGSTELTRKSSNAGGSGLSRTLQRASTDTAIPEEMKTVPIRMAPPPKKRSSSAWPLFGMRASGSSGAPA
eukprot:scaffold3291_cov109-Isochrysis_galbana.AAC.9